MTKVTHKVLDLIDTDFGGDTDGVFEGTLPQCEEFVEEQGHWGYKIVPITENDNN
jgi:hypothetical protein